MAPRTSPRRPPPTNLVPLPAPLRRRASLASLIDALLENADLRHELGGGRALLRLSAAAIARSARMAALGEDARRLADLAVIWDEREDVLIRVLDGTPQTVEPQADGRDDRFELTDSALAYIAQSQSIRRG
ncbi:MAG: hypothetical protein ACYC8V_15675 [Caulobacteraceae bacterium]